MPKPTSLLAVLAPIERDNFFPGALLDQLRGAGAEFRLLDPTGLTAADFARELAAANPEALLGCWQTPPLPAELPPLLRYFCYVTGSVRRLVTRGQIERGLVVTNWGGAISRMVAECALLHTLACLRRLTHWTIALHREGAWRDGMEGVGSLFQRRVGIHGFGSVAREFLKLIRPFDCRVAVCAPDVDDAAAAKLGVHAVSLEALFTENDVIVELAPLTPETTGVVTERHLRLIRPGGVFVNVGRGAVTDEAALVRIAAEGKISVGLDVFVTEPLPADSPWRGLRNASLTPHIAGPTLDRYVDAGEFALRNLRAYAEGRALEAVITPERYDAIT